MRRRFLRTAAFAWLYLKRPFLLPRVRRPTLERIDGVTLLSLPAVLNPVVFRSGGLLARTVASSPLAEPSANRALDMGTGTGVGAVFLARRGWRVAAVDLNPEAVRCARINVLLNRLEDRVEVRQGDVRQGGSHLASQVELARLADGHALGAIEQQIDVQVFFFLEALDQQFIVAGVDIPIEVAEVFGGGVFAVFGKLNAAAKDRAASLGQKGTPEDPSHHQR